MKTAIGSNIKKIASLLICSLGALAPAFAEHSDYPTPKTQLDTEPEAEFEFYDYHAGITYTGTLQNYLYRHVDNLVRELDNKRPEQSQQQ